MKIVRHGRRGTPEYFAWASMVQRCTNPRAAGYARYGGRGISVCERWVSFPFFFEDMGARPKGKSLDRIDNDKGYSPANCRWASDVQQRENRCCTVFVDVKGERISLKSACDRLGLPRHPIYKRIKRGWTIEKALSTPIQTVYPRRRKMVNP